MPEHVEEHRLGSIQYRPGSQSIRCFDASTSPLAGYDSHQPQVYHARFDVRVRPFNLLLFVRTSLTIAAWTPRTGELDMHLPILQDKDSLCDQCVALCCRYYAFSIDKPKTMRDFEDLRWFMLHEDTIIFVEEGDWHVQVNRKCKELLPNNRCGIYENRPTICREYKTVGCDWHAEEYDYDELFVEPEQIQAYAREYLSKKRKRAAAAGKKKRTKSTSSRTRAVKKRTVKKRTVKKRTAKKVATPIQLRKSA
jgi:Fe-S-cluster containining protein